MRYLYLLLIIVVGLQSCNPKTAIIGEKNQFTEQPTKKLIPRKVLFSPTDKGIVQLRPDGQKVGYSSKGKIIIKTLVGGEEKALELTEYVLNWKWTYQNAILAVTYSKEGDKLWLIKDGTIKELTLHEGQKISLLALSSALPKQFVVSLKGGKKASKNGIYRISMNGNEKLKLVELDNFDRWYFDNQLNLKAGRRPNKQFSHDLMRYTSAGKWELVKSYPFYLSTARAWINNIISIQGDGEALYYVDNSNTDKSILKSMNIETGEEQVLVEDEEADLIWAGGVLHPKTNAPQTVVSIFGKTKVHFLDASLKKDFDFLKTVRQGDISFVGRSQDDSIWLIRYLTGTPLTYYIYNRKTQTVTRLFSDLSALDDFELAERHPFIVKTKDNTKLPCMLYLPPDADKDKDGIPDRPLPTILYVHGGPWVGWLHNSWFSNRNFQLLANRGYAVINTEFRSAYGYGKKFHKAGDLEWGGKMHQDLVDIAKAAVKSKIAIEDKVGIWGWSYGGYATFGALGYSPDLFACGIAMYGVADLESFAKLPFASNDFWRNKVGNPKTDEGMTLLRKHSPIRYVKEYKRPILVTHGSKDDRTPQSQSDVIVQQLKVHQKEVTYFVYPDEPHDYRQAKSWISFWAIAEKFLQKHLGGFAETYGDDLKAPNFKMLEGIEHIKGLREQLEG